MVKTAAYTDNGTVVIESLDPNVADNDYITLFQGRGFADVIIVDDSAIPDLNYTEAFEINNGVLEINLEAAKECRKKILRRQANKEIEGLKTAYVKIVSKRKNPSTVKNRIDYLQDVEHDPAFGTATTTTDLDAITISTFTPPSDYNTLDPDPSLLPPTVQSGSIESVTSTTSRNYVKKLNLNITTDASNYLVVWYGEVYTSNQNRKVHTRIRVDDSDILLEQGIIPVKSKTLLDWESFSGHKIYNFTAGSHTVDISIKGGGSSVSIRRCRIMVSEIKEA